MKARSKIWYEPGPIRFLFNPFIIFSNDVVPAEVRHVWEIIVFHYHSTVSVYKFGIQQYLKLMGGRFKHVFVILKGGSAEWSHWWQTKDHKLNYRITALLPMSTFILKDLFNEWIWIQSYVIIMLMLKEADYSINHWHITTFFNFKMDEC